VRRRSPEIQPVSEIPQPPDFDRHVILNTPLDHIWKYVNPVMLYGRHLGLKGSILRTVDTEDHAILAARGAPGRKALELREAVDQLKAECRAGAMTVKAVYRFFKAESDGNTLFVLDGQGNPVTQFTFPRQDRDKGLCLSDYVSPRNSGQIDNIALFVVTAGAGIRQRSEELKAKGEFLKCHALQALALESAEAYAELLHGKLRSMWGFPDAPEMTMLDRFKANYRGKRYSFGYPACPRLEDQEQLFKALSPEEIGVQLTDGCMMDPEASVSAIAFHHPQATYFSVTDLGADRAVPVGMGGPLEGES
jgi:5-methyltetrahydrofolate--homocysteine methyltransferase